MIYYWPSKVAKTVAARSQVARTALAAGSHEFTESQSLGGMQRFATQSLRESVFFADGALTPCLMPLQRVSFAGPAVTRSGLGHVSVQESLLRIGS